ncbi:MAG: DUF1446 domain-containing protein [Kiloniellales bacterium]|nr:DUF1446 domain-containing protein [Kiloniellales bacterium]
MSAALRLAEAFSRGARRPLRILGASGQLGYGVPSAAFKEGLKRSPDMIGCDMGSIDIGPNYLGSGTMATTRAGAKRDLRKVLRSARTLDIPLVIGSAGSAGAAPHLTETLEIVREIAREDGLSFKLASIAADIPRETVKQAIRARKVLPMDTMPELREDEVDAAAHLVAQMGLEAMRRGLETGADVVVAGRACDTAIFAALPAILGFPLGLATHMAKIVECASICCVPGGRDSILATLDDEGFELESMNPARAATPHSVAAHGLYEQADPFEIREPGGSVDLGHVRYEALDARRTRVSGARFKPATAIRVKLEGARLVGQRSVLLCATTDPRFIERHESIFAGLKELVGSLACEEAPEDYRLLFRLYGVNGGHDWKTPAPAPREAFILAECIAPTLDRAEEVVRTTKQCLLHYGFEGRLSTAGNVAFPFTPPEVAIGPAFRFNVFHLMEADDLERLFPVDVEAL